MMKPKQGEIWLVNFDPQLGSEIKKMRPAIVISHRDMDSLPLRQVVPIRHFREEQKGNFFLFPIEMSKENGLVQKSHVDCVQIKSFSFMRFYKYLGKVQEEELKEICERIAMSHRFE